MRHTVLVAVALLAGASTPAFAQNLSNVALSNIKLGAGAGGLGQAGLNNSASLSGSRISATTSVVSVFAPGTNTNPAGNNGLGGVTAGFAETTRLSAGGEAIANTRLDANGSISASLNPPALNAGVAVGGSLTRVANSNAATGMSGYSGSQLNGPGGVSNIVNGNALAVGAAVTGSAGLSR